MSVLAAPDEAALDLLAATTLQRESVLTLVRMGVLRAAGLEVRPTFRRPHCTVMRPAPEAELERLVACDNELRQNPHYVAPEARP